MEQRTLESNNRHIGGAEVIMENSPRKQRVEDRLIE